MFIEHSLFFTCVTISFMCIFYYSQIHTSFPFNHFLVLISTIKVCLPHSKHLDCLIFISRLNIFIYLPCTNPLNSSWLITTTTFIYSKSSTFHFPTTIRTLHFFTPINPLSSQKYKYIFFDKWYSPTTKICIIANLKKQINISFFINICIYSFQTN